MAVEEVDREIASALREVLRRHRDATGLTQEQLAAKAGIDWKYYQSLESGKGNSSRDSIANPTLQVLRKLAGAYGVPVPDLIWDVFNDKTGNSD